MLVRPGMVWKLLADPTCPPSCRVNIPRSDSVHLSLSACFGVRACVGLWKTSTSDKSELTKAQCESNLLLFPRQTGSGGEPTSTATSPGDDLRALAARLAARDSRDLRRELRFSRASSVVCVVVTGRVAGLRLTGTS